MADPAPASKRFRDDIDPANTWVTSDSHFGHENIVGFCHRPEDHEQVMIAEWRAQVPDDATVLHLGDLAFRNNAHFKHITARELNGARKLLIMGNHDKQRYSFYSQSGFKLARPFSIRYGDPNNGRFADISFSHYPWSTGDEGHNQQPWEWRLHGHIHNGGYSRGPFVPFLRNHINLSVEQTKYRPVNLKILLDAAIWGIYEETTDEQIEAAVTRREARLDLRNNPEEVAS